MKWSGSFRRIGTLDSELFEPLKALALRQTDADWYADKKRAAAYPSQSAAQTLALLFDVDERHRNPTRHPKYAEFATVLEPVLQVVARALAAEGSFIRIMLTRLVPHGYIPPHPDFGFSHAHSHRVHIPLVTNDLVEFTVAGETQALHEREIWEINNLAIHSVVSRSPEHRIHLIMDWALPIQGLTALTYPLRQAWHVAYVKMVGLRTRYFPTATPTKT